MEEIIRKGVKTKVLLLSATPVNNQLADLRNQISFIAGGDVARNDEANTAFAEKLGVASIRDTTRLAQTHFTRWSDPTRPPTLRKTRDLIAAIGGDFEDLAEELGVEGDFLLQRGILLDGELVAGEDLDQAADAGLFGTGGAFVLLAVVAGEVHGALGAEEEVVGQVAGELRVVGEAIEDEVVLLFAGLEKGYAPRSLSPSTISDAPSRKSNAPGSESSGWEISNALRSEPGQWKPGRLNPNLSWTHYRTLMRVERPDARAFYEIEAVKESWSARELERQIASHAVDRVFDEVEFSGEIEGVVAGNRANAARHALRRRRSIECARGRELECAHRMVYRFCR
jgi:hypothetical protein